MRSKLDLDPGVVAACRQAARQIADEVAERTAGHTTVSVERSVTRLLGVDGANHLDAPLPNVLVDHVHERGGLDRGIAHWLGNAMLRPSRPRSWTWSTSTFGSGASSPSAPSTPSRRVTLRSTDTVVWPAISSETCSAICSAACRHAARIPGSRPSFELMRGP